MFSGFGSPSLKSVQRRLSKSISRAGELLTGVGPTPTKQFKNAIIDGEEDKAIDIYTASEGDKPLYLDLHPSKPFPSKKEKSSTDTPLHMASRAGLMKLCVALLGKGGDPTVLNERLETCLHSVCSESSHPDVRTAIMEILLQWRGVSENVEEGVEEKVSLNRVDNDGDTAIHLAALNGLVGCVEKLVALGAIISIVNKNNRTCCELADENGHSSLALALELALVFQPVDVSMAEFVASQRFPYDGHQGRLLLSGQSFVEGNDDLNNFIEEALLEVATTLQEKDRREAVKKSLRKGRRKEGTGKSQENSKADVAAGAEDEECFFVASLDQYNARAEALLGAYAWNVAKLVKEYREDPSQVLSGARLQPLASQDSPTAGKELTTLSASTERELTALAASTETVLLSLPPPPPTVDETTIITDSVGEDKHEEMELSLESECEATGSDPLDTTDIGIELDPMVAGGDGDEQREEVSEQATSADQSAVEGDKGVSVSAGESNSREVLVSRSEVIPSSPVETGLTSVLEDLPSPPLLTSAAASSTLRTAETVAPMDVDGFCFVCGEAMLPGLPVERFLAGGVDNAGSRRLQCGSGHAFCVDCWSGSLTVQVKDNGLGCLPCLGFKCGEVLDKRWAAVLLPSAELRNHFLQRRQRLVVDCCSALKACPIDGCGVVVRVAGLYEAQPDALKHSIPASALCSNGHLFCLECSQLAHSPCTCQQLTAWQKLVQDEIKSVDVKGKGGDDSNVQGADLANALWVAANTKKCPRCQTPIEKDEGCNHMNCRKCRKEFCWICMQDWSLHSDNTGGYFQCNRFVANAKVGDLADGGNELVGNLWAEESGNAHAETMRLREKNKRMARFIHHFTRYQAHRDSVQLEGRMFKETARRIGEGLLASREGGTLKWLQGYQVAHPLQEVTAEDQSAEVNASLTSAPVSGEKSGSSGSVPSPVASEPVVPTKRASHFTYSTAFLKDGFEELLKCRCILQWSYPYAYFEFEFEDYNDYARSAAQQQRARYGRGHHATFDLLQSELEAIVETLSDVVARRRLRAGKDQISLVTRAARSKRIELESVIVTTAINQQNHRNRVSPASGAANAGSAAGGLSARNSAPASRPRSRSRPESRSTQSLAPGSRSGRSSRNNAPGPVASLFRTDSEESIDLASLIFELEMASATDGARLVNASRDAPATSVSDAASLLQARSRQLESLEGRLRQTFGDDGSAAATASGVLPPPIPTSGGGSAAGSGRRSVAAAANPPGAGGTPNARRLELRQTRNSPGGHHISYSIDPDFNMESDDSDSGSEADEAYDDDEVGNADTGATPHRTLSSSLPPASQQQQQQQSSADSSARAGDYERAAALRELLRFGSAGGAHARESTNRDSSRQQMREIRLRERAEEEQALNRAILMSLQENQSAERRRRSAVGNNAAVGSAAENGDGAEGGEPAPAAVSSEPTEGDVAMLVSMGFTREQATQALIENRMDVELAANRLLGIDF